MADDANTTPHSPDSPNFQPAPSAAPPTTTANVTAARPAAGPPPAPRFSLANAVKGYLRSALNVLVGGVVGAVGGLVLYGVLHFLQGWNGDWRLVVGAGLLLGVFFNGAVVRLLRLAPRKELEARSAAAADQNPADAPAPSPVRETIEMLVSVVILVVLLKSFDAEAYVIPTGSMAETLLGDQKWVVCPDCGYRFPVDCSDEVDSMKAHNYPVTGCTCPNCRQHVEFVPPSQWRESNPPALDAIPDPGRSGGDRILASKFMYELFGVPPEREDVVVFKFPGNGGFPPTGSIHDGVQINYIKRLIGLPRETIAIHGGDLYYLPADKGPQYPGDLTDPEMARTPGLDPARRLWEPHFMHADDAEVLTRFAKGEFQIVRKPPETILAMRRIVYDNDHPAKDLHAPRWTDRDKNGAWKADDAHGFHLTAPADDKPHWLGYRHRLRGAEDKDQLITDFMGYNTAEPDRGPSGVNWVGDLILECDVQADQPAGELTLELSKGVDRFQARFDLASGGCSLLRVGQDKPLDSRPTALKGGGKHAVRFANVDQRLTVWVDDALPFGDGVPYDAPKTEGPTEKNDREPAGVGLKGVGGAVAGLRLWRDTYYSTAMDGVNPAAPDAGPGVNFADPTTWNRLRDLPTRTMYVQPGNYLCLGDNSPRSSDGRFWGLVPERLLLGKAVAVFYPLDRVERIR